MGIQRVWPLLLYWRFWAILHLPRALEKNFVGNFAPPFLYKLPVLICLRFEAITFFLACHENPLFIAASL